jgi:hypothetical protein
MFGWIAEIRHPFTLKRPITPSQQSTPMGGPSSTHVSHHSACTSGSIRRRGDTR